MSTANISKNESDWAWTSVFCAALACAVFVGTLLIENDGLDYYKSDTALVVVENTKKTGAMTAIKNGFRFVGSTVVNIVGAPVKLLRLGGGTTGEGLYSTGLTPAAKAQATAATANAGSGGFLLQFVGLVLMAVAAGYFIHAFGEAYNTKKTKAN